MRSGWPPQYRQRLEKQFSFAGNNRTQLAAALRGTVEPEHREAMAVLLAHMPQCDRRRCGQGPALGRRQVRLQGPRRDAVGRERQGRIVLQLRPALCHGERQARRLASGLLPAVAPAARQCRTPTDAALLLNRIVYAQLHVRFHPRSGPRRSRAPTIGRGGVRLLHRHVDPADRRLPIGRHPGAAGRQSRLDREDRQSLPGWRFRTAKGEPSTRARRARSARPGQMGGSQDRSQAARTIACTPFPSCRPRRFSVHLVPGQPRGARRQHVRSTWTANA